MMLVILVMMKSEVVMVKKKWQSAKFGGNDGEFHLEANMSAAPQTHWEAWRKLADFDHTSRWRDKSNDEDFLEY